MEHKTMTINEVIASFLTPAEIAEMDRVIAQEIGIRRKKGSRKKQIDKIHQKRMHSMYKEQ